MRDTLRLEAGMPLYGHELGEEINALESGVDFAIALDKEEAFIGQDALRRTRDQGLTRRLTGLILEGKRTARQGMTVRAGGNDAGIITSGCVSPTLGSSIAMAYVDPALADPDTPVEIDAGRATLTGKTTALPFYRHA